MTALTRTMAGLVLMWLGSNLAAETITILNGPLGNANFEASEPADGALTYADTPHWFHASGSEDTIFTTETQTAGSSVPNSRACIPAHERVQVNDVGYTVTSAGDVFSLEFDFGRTGDNWDGDETYRAFLFTTSVPVDENIALSEITEVAALEYAVPADTVWENGIQFNAFYVTTNAEVGQTLFLGMVLSNSAGEEVSPRLDEINLTIETELISGDVNADGLVNLLDVNPMIELLTTGTYQVQADINLDGAVNLADVQPFVALLSAN